MSLPTPDPIGVWLLKWIIAPLALLGIIGFGIANEMQVRKCHRMATEHGYLDSWIAPGRRGSPAECHCKRQERPDGTIDDKAVLVLNIESGARIE